MSPLQDLSLRTGLDVARMFELYQDVRVKSLGNALGLWLNGSSWKAGLYTLSKRTKTRKGIDFTK